MPDNLRIHMEPKILRSLVDDWRFIKRIVSDTAYRGMLILFIPHGRDDDFDDGPAYGSSAFMAMMTCGIKRW